MPGPDSTDKAGRWRSRWRQLITRPGATFSSCLALARRWRAGPADASGAPSPAPAAGSTPSSPLTLTSTTITSTTSTSATSSSATSSSATSMSASSPRAGAAPRVLVVDDTVVIRQLLRLLLQRLGCEVDEAADGAAALAALDAGAYDLVLMDCMMPVLDGYQACRRLRRCEQVRGAARLAVVALTASAFERERERCLEAGMDDYVSKPFSAEQIAALVQRWASWPAP